MQKFSVLLFTLLIVTIAAHAQRANKSSRETLLRGPYLQAATPTSIVIRWRTDVLARGIVRYGASADRLDHNAQDSVIETEHKIKLSSLQPNTKYYYAIGSIVDTLATGP